MLTRLESLRDIWRTFREELRYRREQAKPDDRTLADQLRAFDRSALRESAERARLELAARVKSRAP